MTQTKITANLGQFENLLKELGGKYYTRVGILGDDANKLVEGEQELRMSELGVIQEFGSMSRNIPRRSFLEMPLEVRQTVLIQALGKQGIKKDIEAGKIKSVYAKLGVVAEEIIQDAFSSGGFGHWLDNADSTISRKGSDDPLIDKGELRRSITSEVVVKGGMDA
jgi:hypothetical protein